MSFFCCLRPAFTFERGFNQTLSSMIMVAHQKVFFLRPFFISMLLRLINIKVHIISTILFLVQLVKQASDTRRLGAVLSCIQLCMTFIIEHQIIVFLCEHITYLSFIRCLLSGSKGNWRIIVELPKDKILTFHQSSEIVNIICATSTSAVISLLSYTERNTLAVSWPVG